MKLKPKLIIILSSIFFLTLLLDFYLGNLYFEKYFRFAKIKSLEKIDFISNGRLDLDRLTQYKFSKNADVILLNKYTNKFVKQSDFTYFILKNTQQKNTIFLSPYINKVFLQNKFSLNKNEKITVKAIKIFNNYLMAYEIEKKDETIKDFDINLNKNKTVTLSGEIYTMPHKGLETANEFLELYPYLDLTAIQNRSVELKDKRRFQLITKDIDRFKVLIFYKFKPVNEIFPMLKLYFTMKIGLLILVTVFLGFLIEKLIIKPIVSLANNTNKIGSFNHNFSLNYSSNDEISYLYRNIKRMTEKLESIIYFYKKENQDNIKSKIEFENELKLFMHEIKTPLSAIIGFTDLFLEKNESENIKIVNEEGRRILRLANELIHKKNVTNQISLNKEIFNIAELTDLILKIYENELQNLKVIFSSQNIFVHADKEKIKQVIINLLSNAIEHANSLISIDIDDSIEGKIKFTIENDGEKLSATNLNNIWKKYYSTKNSHGRGLGLYITSEIIKLHENIYGVDLTENGIAFYFYLNKNE